MVYNVVYNGRGTCNLLKGGEDGSIFIKLSEHLIDHILNILKSGMLESNLIMCTKG